MTEAEGRAAAAVPDGPLQFKALGFGHVDLSQLGTHA
jgi:hypothetical protein